MLFKNANPKLVEIAKKLATPEEGYPEDFLIHVAYIIRKQEMDIDEVREKLPSSKIICDDIKLISDIAKESHCYFECIPISYQYFYRYLEDETLEGLFEVPSYSTHSIKKDALFTKTQFIESIKKSSSLVKKLV